jgi:UDP-2-acetamido-3-amino-2,3-dideoxy-glucuronate N-acetyltransferase
MIATDAVVHPSALIEDAVTIGTGTRIWHNVHVRSGVTIGERCILGRDVYIDEDIRIGNNVKIQNRVSLYKHCVIEDGVFIGPHVCFTNDLYPRAINPDATLKSADDWHAGSTWVGVGAAIGAGSIILPSKRIGRFALVGAGSVVTRDVADHELVVGNPARPIGFACRCGARLVPEGNEGFACPTCGDHYQQTATGTLTRADDHVPSHQMRNHG